MSSAKSSSKTGDAATAKSRAEAVANAIRDKLLMASIGEIALVFSLSTSHNGDALADIASVIVPAVTHKQFYVVEDLDPESGVIVPVAVATWAFVSPEVDARLCRTVGPRLRLSAPEWASGEIGWIIDLVGDPKAIQKVVAWLATGPFKTRAAKIAVREGQNRYRVGALAQFTAGGSMELRRCAGSASEENIGFELERLGPRQVARRSKRLL